MKNFEMEATKRALRKVKYAYWRIMCTIHSSLCPMLQRSFAWPFCSCAAALVQISPVIHYAPCLFILQIQTFCWQHVKMLEF